MSSIVDTHPSIAEEWSPRNPVGADQVTKGSSVKALWVDALGHEWAARVADRALKNSGCPYCKNQKVLEGFNDLQTTNPTLAAEYHPENELKVTEITERSLRVVSWIGSCGHAWKAKPVNRTLGTGCPFCANQKILVGFNDFASTCPELMQEWSASNTMDPTQLSRVSRARVQWVCAVGHTWKATIKDRATRGGTSCPKCVNVRESKIESYLCESLASNFGQTIQQYDTGLRWPSGHKVVVDGFVPELNLIVEWDGSKWHASRVDKDREKSEMLLDAEFKVLRLRERPLPMLAISHANYSELAMSHRAVEPYFEAQIREGVAAFG